MMHEGGQLIETLRSIVDAALALVRAAGITDVAGAEDILPLVASLTPQERTRLLRLIALPQGADAPVYQSLPPSRDEFSADDEPLAWEAEGWEDVA